MFWSSCLKQQQQTLLHFCFYELIQVFSQIYQEFLK